MLPKLIELTLYLLEYKKEPGKVMNDLYQEKVGSGVIKINGSDRNGSRFYLVNG